MKSARRRSRELATQGLYQWLLSGAPAGEIDAHDAFEFVHRHFLNRAIANDAGVVHENVEPAMSILYLFHHRFDLLRLGHVAFDHERILQLLRYALGVGFVSSFRVGDVIHYARGAAFPESLDHFRADPARAARDEHNFAIEIEIRHFLTE